jgi:uncharacterized protein (TIGR02001 family)
MRLPSLFSSSALVVPVLCAALAATAPARAEEGQGPFSLSGTAAITNDYVFRGFSQTGEDPAVQAGLTVTHESGFYANAWASNVDFGFGSDIEVDLIAGYSNSVGDLTYTISGLYYLYPGAESSAKLDYFEAGLDLAYAIDQVTLTSKLYYSPEFFGEAGGDALYLAGGASYALNDFIALTAGIGFTELQKGDDYQDYSVGITLSYEPFSLALQYIDTDVKDVKEADSRFVATLTFAF